jgi:hypothetical protein
VPSGSRCGTRASLPSVNADRVVSYACDYSYNHRERLRQENIQTIVAARADIHRNPPLKLDPSEFRVKKGPSKVIARSRSISWCTFFYLTAGDRGADGCGEKAHGDSRGEAGNALARRPSDFTALTVIAARGDRANCSS